MTANAPMRLLMVAALFVGLPVAVASCEALNSPRGQVPIVSTRWRYTRAQLAHEAREATGGYHGRVRMVHRAGLECFAPWDKVPQLRALGWVRSSAPE